MTPYTKVDLLRWLQPAFLLVDHQTVYGGDYNWCCDIDVELDKIE